MRDMGILKVTRADGLLIGTVVPVATGYTARTVDDVLGRTYATIDNAITYLFAVDAVMDETSI